MYTAIFREKNCMKQNTPLKSDDFRGGGPSGIIGFHEIRTKKVFG